MKDCELFEKIMGGVISDSGLLYGSYTYGNYDAFKKLEKPMGWKNLSSE